VATYEVGLIGRDTGRTFLYKVATLAPSEDVDVFRAALAEHGRNILLERVDEIVRDDLAEVTQLD